MNYYMHANSPAGSLLIIGTSSALRGLYFDTYQCKPDLGPRWTEDARPFTAILQSLDEYFGGGRRVFDIPMQYHGTSFQEQVWSILLAIPYGQYVTYKEIAQTIGRPAASRAVGNAIGANPISIVIPCHRVLTTSGSISGFGGGIPAKRYLLRLEQEAVAKHAKGGAT